MTLLVGWVLHGITDYRPLDFATGELLPAMPAGERCAACGGEHEQLYHVHERDTGRSLDLGSSCIAGACAGWTPGPKALARALAEVEAGRVAARELALDEEADALAATLGPAPRGVDLRRWVLERAGDAIGAAWLPSYVDALVARTSARVTRRG